MYIDSIELNVIYFTPVYILYILLIVLQLQIGLTALGIGRRYRRLNIILSKLSLRGMYVSVNICDSNRDFIKCFTFIFFTFIIFIVYKYYFNNII